MSSNRGEVKYRAKYFSLVEEQITLPNGSTVTRGIVRHPGAVVVVPKDTDDRLVLVHQFRASLGYSIYEFPAGTIESAEAPELCARREIEEEIDCAAATWISMGTLIPAPGFCDEVQYLFGATDLSPKSAPKDDDEIIVVERFTPREVEEAIRAERIVDAKTIAAFFKARVYGFI